MLEAISLPKLTNGNKIIFGAVVGSHAYGTNVEGSDVDKKWIYVQSATDFHMNGFQPSVKISKDEEIIELTRFLELARKANPTMLELLFTPSDCVIYKHPAFDKVLNLRRYFVTKQCRYSFGGYAIDQIEKARGLEKLMNWEKERTVRKAVLDFCYYIDHEVDPKEGAKFQSVPLADLFTLAQIKGMGLSSIPHTKNLYNLFWDAKYTKLFKGVVQDPENSNDISLSDVPKDAHCIGMLFFNKEAWQRHCKDHLQYQTWLKERNTQRYIDVNEHGQQIDGKNLLHCIRLIDTAIEIAKSGEVVVRRPNAEFLKDIRRGKHNLNSILRYAEVKLKRLKALYDASHLPDKFDNDSYIKLANYQVRKIIAQEAEAKPQY
jgi:hypothetical protein